MHSYVAISFIESILVGFVHIEGYDVHLRRLSGGYT